MFEGIDSREKGARIPSSLKGVEGRKPISFLSHVPRNRGDFEGMILQALMFRMELGRIRMYRQ